ncbi:FK506-binding protein 15-like isoform X2 [Lycorma delicatula]|uniref:FK506-binding protein 15-like isoform X2 n=1 Tax=Lycorma delicatula TaxID=130591 RepID=UPI003F519182
MYSEDDDFSPYSSNSKKLAFLFEKSSVTTGGNSSLMYKAPKQPRNQQHQDDHAKAVSSTSLRSQVHSSDSCLSLILLKVVQTFKLENNEYKSQGKLGAAILGNSNGNHYQLILYKEKTSVVAQAVLTSQFWFAVQPNNYTTFYDKHKILWSILFDGTACAIEFCTRVAVARWNCSDKNDTLVQDLVVMEGSKSVEGSVLDISYTVSLLVSSNKVEENIESTGKITMTIASMKDSSEKVWESMLIGMSEGSKRCIVLPASQSEKWKKYVRDNSSCGVLLVVHLNNIKSNKSDYVVTSDLNTSAEQSEKIKNESIKDAKTNSASSVRANLISRMAKMGQATLPFKTGARVPTVSDSDETEEDGLSMESSDGMNKTCSTKNNIKQATQQSHYPDITRTSVPANQVMDNTDAANTMGRLSTYGGNLVPSSGHVTTTSYTSYVDPQLSLFLSDLRSHNSELRNNINRITCKVEKVLDKVDSLDSVDKLFEQLKSLEQKISQFTLMNQQNNENIGVARKDDRSFLLQKTINPLETLKKENTDLLLELSQMGSKVNELQAKIIHLETIKLGLQNQLVNEKDSRNVMQKEHVCLMEKLKSQLICHDSNIKNVQSSLDRVTEKVLPLENRIKEKSKFNFKSNEEDVKKIMKTVFENIKNKFSEDSKMYTSSEIHSALAEIIKLNTLEYLQNKTVDVKNKSSCESLTDTQEELNEQTCLTEISSVRLETNSNGTAVNDDKVNDKDNDDKVDTCKSDETMANSQEDSVLNCKDPLTFSERSSCNSDGKLKDVESSTSSVNDLTENQLPKNIECKLSKDSVDVELESQMYEIKEETKRDSEKCKEVLEDSEKFKEVLEDSEKCSESIDQSPRGSVVNDNIDENWRSQPPPLSFDEEDKNTDDDWLKM